MLTKYELIVEELNDESIIQSTSNPLTIQELESDEVKATASSNITWCEATDMA